MKGLGRFILECVFPRKCLSCADYSGQGLLCERCAARLMRAVMPSHIGGADGPPVVSPFFTGEALLEVVRFLKFEGGTSAAGWLGGEMASAITAQAPDSRGSILVPVPLHWTRLARRGFDQAVLLSAEVSRITGMEVARGVLRRKRRTRAQSSLDHGRRRGNIEGAFSLRAARRIRGRHVVLVDDLVTTGETALSCCRALREGEPASITVLCAGRTGAGQNMVECPRAVVVE